jgi:hypothetical protein
VKRSPQLTRTGHFLQWRTIQQVTQMQRSPATGMANLKSKQPVEAAGASRINRRVLMNIMVSAAAVATPIKALSSENSPIAGTGAQFESLFVKYFDTSVEWARLHRSAHAAFTEKLGHRFCRSNTPEGEAQYKILDAIFESNGCDRASDHMGDLYDRMNPLADAIKETSEETIVALRYKTLVALWEALPFGAYNNGQLNLFSEYDGGALRVMFDAAVSLTGLEPLVNSIKSTLATNACSDPNEEQIATAATDNNDPIFAAIEAHRNAEAAYDVQCRQNDHLEAEICSEKRRTKGAEIVETDDPRWIAFEQELDRLGDIELGAEAELANVVPTTPAGVVALLKYAADHEKRGCQWRDLCNENDQTQCTWYEAVLQNIVEGLKAS